jgi:hypothetical protein
MTNDKYYTKISDLSEEDRKSVKKQLSLHMASAGRERARQDSHSYGQTWAQASSPRASGDPPRAFPTGNGGYSSKLEGTVRPTPKNPHARLVGRPSLGRSSRRMT